MRKGEYKCGILEIHLKLRDEKHKTVYSYDKLTRKAKLMTEHNFDGLYRYLKHTYFPEVDSIEKLMFFLMPLKISFYFLLCNKTLCSNR